MTINVNDITALVSANHPKPFSVLGLNPECENGYLVISTFQPFSDSVSIIDKHSKKTLAKLAKVNENGLFSKKLRRKNTFEYQLALEKSGVTTVIEDAFAFQPTLGELDIHLLKEGKHLTSYKKLGAHICHVNGVEGTSFAVWAPNASHVAVIGDFNRWDGRVHPMQNIVHHGEQSGYWNIFIPHVNAGHLYKFEIKDRLGNLLPAKADPFGIQAQYRPDTASIVDAENHFNWRDNQWLEKREQRNARDAAISIYEVHLASWRKTTDNNYLNYREIAAQLIPYVLDMGFTHIQLMPVSEYPFDGSWGYQPVGLFAPTSRFGSSEDFQCFVDACHQADIGLLIDWVPGHFPSDPHGLATFDGTHLFEHEDPRQGYHPDWNTLIYNYGRTEVVNFLTASALHWLDRYHVDGIRVDAVASMLYLDYSRKEGEWVPNKHGGRENLQAVDFLQHFNCELYKNFPGTFSVAEESTSWPGVSRPTDSGGLGFGYKWNMGWMNDSLRYMSEDPIHKAHHHDQMSFSLVYAFDENFILPLSHDEVVHGKGSILDRMPGDCWQQFANLRAYYGFMWAHPGKKLLFMGCEFAQGREWDHDNELDWHQLDIHWHSGVQRLVKDLNAVYKNTPALYQKDCEADGFTWLEHDNAQQSIYSFIRFGDAFTDISDDGFEETEKDAVIVVCNFTPEIHHNYKLGVPEMGTYQELINSDLEIYSGSGQTNGACITSIDQAWQNQAHHISVTIPPLSTIIFSLKKARR